MIQSYVYKYLFFFKFFSQLGCYRILSRVLYAVQYIPLQIGCESESCSVVSDSLRPHGLYSPWNSPGQNTGVGSHSLLQGIFPTQGSNSGLLQDSLLSEARGISSNREARFTKVAVTVLTQATRNLRKTSIITLQAMGTKRFRVPRTHYDLK